MRYTKLLKKIILPVLLVCTSIISVSTPVLAKDKSDEYTFVKKDLKSGEETSMTLKHSKKDRSYVDDDESYVDEISSDYEYNDDEILDYDGNIDDLGYDDYSEILDDYYKNKDSNNVTTDSQISLFELIGRDNRENVVS